MCEDAVYSDARKIYRAAIDSVLPSDLVRSVLNYDSRCGVLSVQGVKYPLNRNVKVIALGKAVLGMVSAVDDLIGSHITEGVASVPVGSLETARLLFPECVPREGCRIRVYEGAAHNLPDAAAELAARDALSLAERATMGELVIVLVSGGGSALLPCPVEGVSLQEKRLVIESLAKAGATIHELNAFRKSLSNTKGGRLAEAAFPAKVVGLVLSDVIGDSLDIIASGPTVPNRTTPADTLEIVSKYSLEDQLPQSVVSYLSEAEEGRKFQQNVVPVEDHNYSHVQNVVIGNNQFATAAAVSTAEQLGYNSLVWSHRIQGEARLLGEAYAKLVHTLLKRQRHNSTTIFTQPIKEEIALALRAEPFATLTRSVPDLCSDFTSLADQLANKAPPLCLVSAGEPIVNVRGSGTGGRNQELALSFALQMHKLQEEDAESAPRGLHPKCLFLSIGTDGQDGPCDAAGAMVDAATFNEARREGLDARRFLDNNDSYTFFSRVNSGRNLIQTGLTGTNVMDLQILLLRQ